jgi:uncharacterized RDD family membrane protein YckC
MAEDFRLETPEAIAVAYDIAGIGTRFLAQVVDVIALVGILGVAGAGIVLLGSLGSLGQTAAVILVLFGSFLVLFGYFTLYEFFWTGQTPGKRALEIRVIKISGYPIGFLDSFIRNLIRLVDYLPSAYGVGVITMFISTQSRRLGDYAAGTIVVREWAGSLPELPARALQEAAAGPTPVAGEEDPDELAWTLHVLTPRDLTLIDEYLARAPSLPPDARARIGTSIAASVSARIGAREPLDPVQFLARVRELKRASGRG